MGVFATQTARAVLATVAILAGLGWMAIALFGPVLW